MLRNMLTGIVLTAMLSVMLGNTNAEARHCRGRNCGGYGNYSGGRGYYNGYGRGYYGYGNRGYYGYGNRGYYGYGNRGYYGGYGVRGYGYGNRGYYGTGVYIY